MKSSRYVTPIVLLALMLVPMELCLGSTDLVFAQSGLLDLRAEDTSSTSIWPLEGQWEWFNQQYLSEIEGRGKPVLVHVPGAFKPDINQEKGHGWGTYRLKVLLDPSFVKSSVPLGIYLPYQVSSSRIWWNGVKIAQAGILGNNFTRGLPEWKVHLLHLDRVQEENELRIEVSNFQDNYMGQRELAWFGSLEGLYDQERSRISLQMILFASLLCLGLYHIGSWIYRRQDTILLFFALTSILFAIRNFFYTDLYILQIFPWIGFETLQKGGFLTFSLASMLFGLYIAWLFPRTVFGHPWLHKGFIALATVGPGLYSAMIVLLDFRYFVPWLPLVELYVTVLCIGILIVLARALYLKQDGAGLFLSGFGLFFILITNDFLTSNHFINTPFLSSLGMVIFLFFQSLVSVKRYAIAHQRTEDSNQSIAALNQSLERFIPGEVLNLLGAKNLLAIEPGNCTRVEATVMVCNIRDFSLLISAQSPQESFSLLNDWLKEFGIIIRKHQGFIDRFQGDGITALFTGAPINALKAACELERANGILNKIRVAEKHPTIKMSIGIHHGQVLAGTVGDDKRIDSLVCSETVTMASMLQRLTKKYGLPILLGEETAQVLEKYHGEFKFWHIADETLGNKTKRQKVFAVKWHEPMA